MWHWRAVVTAEEVELGWMAVGKGAVEQSWKAEAAAAALALCWHHHRQQHFSDGPSCAICDT